jgi:hypothetical protein
MSRHSFKGLMLFQKLSEDATENSILKPLMS